MKVGDLVKMKGAFATHRRWSRPPAIRRWSACGTIIAIDEEDYVTVQWWDSIEFIPNPSMEKPTDLMVICEGDK